MCICCDSLYGNQWWIWKIFKFFHLGSSSRIFLWNYFASSMVFQEKTNEKFFVERTERFCWNSRRQLLPKQKCRVCTKIKEIKEIIHIFFKFWFFTLWNETAENRAGEIFEYVYHIEFSCSSFLHSQDKKSGNSKKSVFLYPIFIST